MAGVVDAGRGELASRSFFWGGGGVRVFLSWFLGGSLFRGDFGGDGEAGGGKWTGWERERDWEC